MTNTAAADIDSQYFIRNATYMMMKDQVVVVDRNSPTVVTMDDWPQLVFLRADGEHTVGQLIADLAAQYPSGPPKGLSEQIRAMVRELVARGYVTLSPIQKKLPYYLSMPVEEQDKDRARKMMEADGFLKPTKR